MAPRSLCLEWVRNRRVLSGKTSEIEICWKFRHQPHVVVLMFASCISRDRKQRCTQCYKGIYTTKLPKLNLTTDVANLVHINMWLWTCNCAIYYMGTLYILCYAAVTFFPILSFLFFLYCFFFFNDRLCKEISATTRPTFTKLSEMVDMLV